jgi:hypothetical protein
LPLIFVTTGARKVFALMDVGPGTHRAHGKALLIEELEINLLAHRRLAVDTAVCLHGDGTDRHAGEKLGGPGDGGRVHLLIYLRE